MKWVSQRSLIILLLVTLVAVGVGMWLIQRDRSLAQLQHSRRIRIGYAIEPPYAFLTPQGEVTGESPEVAKMVVRRLGIPNIEWNVMEFDTLIPALNAGRIDVIAAGMFITPQRARFVSFSSPTFHVQQGLLVAKDNPYQLHSYQQAVQHPRQKITVLSGSVEQLILHKLGATQTQLLVVPDVITGRISVESHLADGLALSSPTIRWMAQHNQLHDTEVAHPFTQPPPSVTGRLGYGAYAFRRQDRRLLAAWNMQLKTIIGSPAHRRLLARFGFTAHELPDGTTTEEILSP